MAKCKKRNSPKKFGSKTTAEQVLEGVDLHGKTILITGTTAGIGTETVRSLALHGAHVVMMNRNIPLSEQIRADILSESDGRAKVDIIRVELSSLASVKDAAQEFLAKGWPLDILILNAALWGAPSKATADGFETTFGVNHLAHFYLVQLLIHKLRQSAPSRLVIVSSDAHKFTGIKPNAKTSDQMAKLIPKPDNTVADIRRYNFSKLCNVLMALRLHHDECAAHNIHVYVLHPGIIPTGLVKPTNFFNITLGYVLKPFFKTIGQGAATTVYCAASPECASESGKYYENCAPSEKLQKNLAHNRALQDALWDKSVEFINTFESNLNHQN